jgi:hypothetical protein
MSDLNVAKINTTLRMVAKLGAESHAAGDAAAKQAKAAGHRRLERKMQTVNKAHRATGTACEATLWLASLVTARMAKSTMDRDVQSDRFLKFALDGVSLVDDLNFEANIVAGLQPDLGKSKPRR